MSEQVTCGRPNAATDPEMNPASQPPSRSGAWIVLAAFIVFCATGGLAWFAL